MLKQHHFKTIKIGKLPKEWDMVRLNEVVEINKESVDLIRTFPDKKFFYIDIDSVENGTGVISDVKQILGNDAPSRARRVMHYNDVLMSTVRPYLKAFAIVPKKLNKQICSTGFAVLSCKETISPQLLFYTLFTKAVIDQCTKMMRGGQYPALNINQVSNITIPLPPLPEQQKIAEILSTVGEGIQTVDEAIGKTDRLKKGLMQELLTKGIGHKEFMETEIGKIPKGWQVNKLINIATLQRGYDLPNQQRIAGQFPVIGSNGVVGYHDVCKLKGPGVIIGRSGTLGNVYYSYEAFWPLNTSLYVKDFHKNLPKYIYYFFQHINLARFFTGTGVPTLNRNLVHPVKYAIPDLKEQEKISEILSTTDKKLEILRGKKRRFERIKQGLMNDLLTGRKRVTI